MVFREILSFFIVAALCSNLWVDGDTSISESPFSVALDALQDQLNYTFQDVALLRRAMTHSSYSAENNKVLSIFGEGVIETAVSMQLLVKDIDVSSKELHEEISRVSKVESSCAADGTKLGLQRIVRVSSNVNSTTPSVVCGAFRAVFGAVALDTGSADSGGKLFLRVHARDGNNHDDVMLAAQRIGDVIM
ncbi:unnamed protein product [Cuscuta campestris]|uniref:RNase III domain-containing protein n=2 Tax=Cuscuta sect. Cleistogrammica TaxID=1824901 RepID=A0A484MF17_9ASTE|nr:hypothetical protein DM860_017749 [Cuscuta australis]VFQ86596.1 unnamed protein product [Cuscuta campestris]